MPSFLIIALQNSISRPMRSVICSGVTTGRCMVNELYALSISGRTIVLLVAWFKRWTIGRGRPAGPEMPLQPETPRSPTPTSAMVGTFGRGGRRFLYPAAIGRVLAHWTFARMGLAGG